MGQIQTLDDLVDMLRRRWLLMALVIGLGALAALAYALSLPRSYEAVAVIQIESPPVAPEDETGGMTAAQRLQLIEQRMMVRENLIGIIDRHGLFADLEALTPGEKVALLRRSVRLETVTAALHGFGSDRRATALLIIVQLDDPVLAATLANEFADSVLLQSRISQTERTRETLGFFAEEEARVGSAIAALEAEIAAFQSQHSDALPGGLSNLRDERLRLGETIREIDLRVLELERERETLASVTPVRAMAQRQIDLLSGQLEMLAEQRAPVAGRLAALDDAIGRAPEVEMALNTFDRRVRQLQDQYSVITRRRAEAETSQRLEANRQAERFSVLEVALPPDYASASGRRKMLVFGIAGSAMLALGLAFLLDLINPVIRSAAQLERQIGLRAVAVIPYIETPAEARKRRAAVVTGAMLALVAAVVALGIAGASYLAG